MSQTETLLLVVLGFSLAALIALFLSRFLWAAALRIGARRMQAQVPSTLVGLQTERDRLRAEYAMLSQRLGSRLEATKLRMAEQMAEVSRHRNRLETLDAALAERNADLAARDSTIAALNQKVEELTAALAREATATAALESALAAARNELETARLHMGESVEFGAGMASEAQEQPADAGDPQQRLMQRIGKLNKMAEAVARDRGVRLEDTVPAQAHDPLLAEKLSEAARETDDIQKELAKLDAEWSKRLGEIKPQKKAHQQRQGGGGVANVISLANRIRALQKDIGNG